MSIHPNTASRAVLRFFAIAVLVLATFAATTPADAAPPDATIEFVDRTNDRVEELRLACHPDIVQGERGALCVWSASSNDKVRGYQLYRIVNGAARELVASVAAGERLHAFDDDLASGDHVVYGVVARNRVGRVIGIGGPVRVGIG